MKIVLIDGTYEGNKGKVGQKLLEALTEKSHIFFMNLGARTGLANLHWDKELKLNRALKQSFDRPYI